MNITSIHSLKNNSECVLFECVSGSHLYGLNHVDSDVDVRGVFITHPNDFFSLDYIPQLSDETNDIVFFELKRFAELAIKNNPNILEILAAPDSKIITKQNIFNNLTTNLFLSKLCKDTFCGYALGQVKKARGLNKKIVSPQPKERKDILDFCYIVDGYKSIPIWNYLFEKYGKNKEYIFENFLYRFGLTKVENGDGLYALFTDENSNFRGILSSLNETQFRLSSISKEVTEAEKPIVFYYNHNGFQVHCKHHKEYWDWVNSRNEHRYKKNMEAGAGYDTKNMMHTFRLLNMGKEILRDGTINVDRTNIDKNFLLSVRDGNFEYEELLGMIEKEINTIDELYKKCFLQEQPDYNKINEVVKSIYHEYK